jgi:hypothetical protein
MLLLYIYKLFYNNFFLKYLKSIQINSLCNIIFYSIFSYNFLYIYYRKIIIFISLNTNLLYLYLKQFFVLKSLY